jgi:hypothetical protein
MCGGKGGTSTTNQSSQIQIPSNVLANYNQVFGMGQAAAAQPFQDYSGQFVAPVTTTQQGGINTIAGAQNWIPGTYSNATDTLRSGLASANPLYGTAAGLAGASTEAVNPSQIDASAINQFMSPYIQSVVDPTTKWLNQQNALQQTNLSSNAISQGAFGGDRSGIASAVLSGQQNMAEAPQIAGLYNQGYAQALAAAQQQQGVNLGAAQANRQALQTGSQLFGQTGNEFLNAGVTGGGAFNQFGTQALQSQLAAGQGLLGAGTVEQQTQQAQDTALYNQFLQQQAYPFQTTQFLGNLAMGMGPLYGSTTTQQGSQFAPQPFFSDDKLKENVRKIGQTRDGLHIVRYNYKDDPHKLLRIGFLASDVEKKMPEAVSKHDGIRSVDYERAARARGGIVNDNESMGGFVDPATHMRETFAEGGGGPGFDPATMAAILAAQQAMYPGAAGRAGIGGSGPRGVELSQGNHPQLMKAQIQEMRQKEQQPELAQDLKAADDLSKTSKDVGSLYDTGKDALVGSPARGTAGSAGYVAPTGGLIGSGGSADWNAGWLGQKTAGLAGNSNVVPLDLAPTDSGSWNGMRRGGRLKRADGGTSGVVPPVNPLDDAPAQEPDWYPPQVAEGRGPLARMVNSNELYRGGVDPLIGRLPDYKVLEQLRRPKRAAGGFAGSGSIPYDASGGYVPVADYQPFPNSSLGQQQRLNASSSPGSSSGSGGGGILGSISGLANLGKLGAQGISGLSSLFGSGGVGADGLPLSGLGAMTGDAAAGAAGAFGAADAGAGAGADAIMGLLPLALRRGGRTGYATGGGLVDGPHAETVRRARDAIGQIESSNRYDAVGPVTKGDRPYGRYQVMGTNVRPWTLAATGEALSPEEFLKKPEVQDKVFDHFFGTALAHHGTPEDAASVWFSGRPLAQTHGERDVLGTSVPEYINKFQRLMGGEGGGAGVVPSQHPLASLSLVSNDDEPDDSADLKTTAGVLNKLGVWTGGRAHRDTGGGLVGTGIDDPIATGDTQVAETPTGPPARPSVPVSLHEERRVPPPPPNPVASPAAPPAPSPTAGVVPDLSAAASAPTAAGVVPDKKDWWDRNEKYVIPALSFLGNMLASPSKTLAGSVGTGVAAAVPAYVGQQRLGQEQERIGISQQQANTQQASAVSNALRLTSTRLALDPTNTALQKLAEQQYNTWNKLIGTGSVAPTGMFTPGGNLYGDPNFDRLIDADNPKYWHNIATSTLDEGQRSSALAQEQAALGRLRSTGYGQGKDGKNVEFPHLLGATAAAEATKTSTVLSAELQTQLGTPGSSLATSNARQKVDELDKAIAAASSDTPDRAKYARDVLIPQRDEIRRKYLSGHARGGRAGFADGGAPDDPDVAGVVPNQNPVQMAQWTPPRGLVPPPTFDTPPAPPPPQTPLTIAPAEVRTRDDIEKLMQERGSTMSPQQRDELRNKQIEMESQKRSTQMQIGAGQVKEARDQANGVMPQMRAMQDMNEQFRNLDPKSWLGPGANPELRKQVAIMSNTVSQALTGKNLVDPNNVAALEEMLKNQTLLAGSATSAMGQHAGYIMDNVQQSTPGPANTPLGYHRVMAGIQQTAQMMQDRADFYDKWYAGHDGDMTGASGAFMKSTDNLRKYADGAILQTIPDHWIKQVKDYAATHAGVSLAELEAGIAPVLDAKWGKGATSVILRSLQNAKPAP